MTRPAKYLLLIWLAVTAVWVAMVAFVTQGVMADYDLPLSWDNIAFAAEVALLPPLGILVFGYLIARSP